MADRADRRVLGALASNPRLDQWVRFERDGRVLIGTGKVELGQGIRTALTAIAADELGVEPGRIHVRPAVTGTSPNEWITAGSGSIEQSGAAVRQACAHARRLLFERGARRLGAAPAALTVDDGCIIGPGGVSVSYWELAADGPFDHTITEPVDPLPEGERRFTGVGLRRVDLPAKVRGEPVFAHDLVLPGLRHARVVRPARPGAALVEVGDVAPAQAAVVRMGSFLAVVADREADAVRAADAVAAAAVWSGGDEVDVCGDRPDSLVAGAGRPTLIVDGMAVDDEVPSAPQPPTGDGVLRARYTKPFTLHGSVGPSSATAWFADGALRVWSHSQGIELLRLCLAPIVGLSPDAITVTHVDGPGCYGHNGADDAAADAALVAVACPDTPIRVTWTRADEHRWEPVAPAMVVDLTASIDARRRITTWDHAVFSPTHAGRPRPAEGRVSGLLASWYLDPPFHAPPSRPSGGFHSGAHRNADPIYDVGAKRVVAHHVSRSALRTSSTRSLGAFANVFAIESFMDELADGAGVDPVTFRLDHLDDDRACAVIEAAVELAGGLAAPGGVDAPGRGLAFARYENIKAFVAVVAEVTVDARTGVVRMEQGWIAADAGEIIDPDGLVNQLEGGVVQAASWTLKERVGLGDSGVTTDDWETYPILRFSEAPALQTRLLDGGGPALGAGEATTGPTAAAIANAVAQATGARLRDLPLRPAVVKAALDALR